MSIEHRPLTKPGKILGIGYNYRAADEERPPVPALMWVKPQSTVIGDGEPIRCPPGTTYLIAETELGVVIGSECRDVDVDEAAAAILGYTCLNDVTAWELYLADRHQQFCSAKIADTFCPLLFSVAVGADPDSGLDMWCRVNGEVRLHGRTDAFVFRPAEVVSHISRLCTLEPGDVVALGSPPQPPPMRPGDHVECGIEGIGTIRNTVEAASQA